MTQIETTLIDHMGSDLSVVNSARVSFGKAARWENEDDIWVAPFIGESRYEMMSPWVTPVLSERDSRLIRYLAKHKHLSPFGHSFASFHVKAPIFVARQLVKHKFLRWNEISRRYVDDYPEFYPMTFRKSAEDKKQGSGGYIGDDQQQQTWYDFDRVQQAAVNAYLNALSEGVAPEQARGILPSTLMTEWYWSGSLDAFAAMCKLRCASDTQYESRIVAEQVSETMSSLFPVSWNALMEQEV